MRAIATRGKLFSAQETPRWRAFVRSQQGGRAARLELRALRAHDRRDQRAEGEMDAPHLLVVLAEALKLVLEGIALLTVTLGLVDSGRFALRLYRERPASAFTDLRIRFGSWLAIALEFQLAADIVATTVRPSTQALLQLGLVALIRTFLNFFLGRELAEQARLRRELAEVAANGADRRDLR